MNNPFLRYRYGGVVSPQQSSGLGSLFPVQQLRGGGSVGGRYSQGLPMQKFYSGGSVGGPQSGVEGRGTQNSFGGSNVGGSIGEARSLALSRAHANSAARAADQRRADTSIRHAQVKAAEESARARQAKSFRTVRNLAKKRAAQEASYNAAAAAEAAAPLSPAAAHLEAARARFAKTRGLKAAIDQVSEPPSKVASVLTSLLGFLAPAPIGLLASAPIHALHNKRNKELAAIAQEYSADLGDLASVLTNKEKSGFLNALSNLGLSFDPSTYEGRQGNLGEGPISSGPGSQVDLLPKPPGGGLATLPQSPSNTTQQVPIPFSPGLSVTIGNPLVPTIFPLS